MGGLMRRAIGALLIAVGLATATLSVGGLLGYFTIFDSGENDPPTSAASMAVMIACELAVVGVGVLLLLPKKNQRNGAA
jgi:uncharacterized membrane protein YidH (DUF202 family)